jgi:hypothetical protein
MKKPIFLVLILVAVLFAISCKSTPPPPAEAEPEQTVEDQHDINTQYSNAYATVRPIILEGAKKYTVKKNDRFVQISRQHYQQGRTQNAYFFPLIMAASEDIEIVDPDLIEPGMELTVPDLRANLADPEIRARIKTLLYEVAKIYNAKDDAPWRDDIRNGLTATADSL